jgi:hypothetical protein
MPRLDRGSSLAWTAVLLSVVLVPLLMLVGDGARLLYVRARLSTAADAACENAAWSTADRLGWQWYSHTDFLQNYLFLEAYNTFYQMLSDSDQVRFSPTLSMSLDSTHDVVTCFAQARVPLLVGSGERIVEVQIRARMRFTGQ